MNAAVERNAKLRRRGKGIFDNANYDKYSRGDGVKNTLPEAPRLIRAAFAREAAAHQRRERWKWIISVVVILALVAVVLVLLSTGISLR